MPKDIHSGNQGHYRSYPLAINNYDQISSRQQLVQVPSQPSFVQTSYTDAAMQSQNYQQTNYHQSGYSNGGPVQPLQTPQYQQVQAPMSVRPSSGAWSPADDQTLMAARAQGMNWQPIQQTYFPSKTPNACRKRHERLMERRSADDWDGIKLENLAKNYMGMRREIWAGLAAQTGEKWNVVEQKCMASGLKNLQSAARSGARRERMLDSTHAHSHSHSHSHSRSRSHRDAYGDPRADDSGIVLDDLEAEYEADRASEHSGSSGVMSQTQYQGRPQYQHRLPSMDMGIGAIINRSN